MNPNGLHFALASTVSHGGMPRILTQAELTRLADSLGIDAIGAAPAEPYSRDRAAHPRPASARALSRTCASRWSKPEVSCHPERLFPEARTVVSAALGVLRAGRRSAPGEGKLPRYAWSHAYAALRERLEELGGRARRRVPRARGREPARRSRGRGAGRCRVLRQEHASHHAPLRIMGRSRHARDRGGDRIQRPARPRTAARAGSASTPARPARSTSPACSTRPAASPTGRRRPARSPRTSAPSSGRRCTAATSARTSVPGTAGPRSATLGRGRPPRRAEPVVSLADWLEAPDDELRERYDRLYFPSNDPRYLRRNALVAAGNSGDSRRSLPLVRATPTAEDELLREHAAWAAERLAGAGMNERQRAQEMWIA